MFKQDLFMTGLILFCLIVLFCIGDYYEKRAVVIGVIATIAYMYWYSKGGNR